MFVSKCISLDENQQPTLNPSMVDYLEKKWNTWPRRLLHRISNGDSREMTYHSAISSQNLEKLEGHSSSPQTAGRPKSGLSLGPQQSMEAIVQDDMVCLLCLQVPDEWFVIKSCGCRFCLQCMEMYALYSIRSGDVPINCPNGLCSLIQQKKTATGGRLSYFEVRLLVPTDILSLYLRLKLNKEVLANPNLLWCPFPGCETVCTLADITNKSKRKKLLGIIPLKRRKKARKNSGQLVLCKNCKYLFCSECKAPSHPDVPCSSFALTGESSDHHGPIAILEKYGKIKRCPKCEVYIEKNEGCAQMSCKQCGHEFCWFCLAPLDRDIWLRHYDGPCRSLLGHPRALVVHHRIRVVSFFMGVSVLILVASPFLLLASPCLLYWKLHSNKSDTNFDSAASPADYSNPSSAKATHPLDEGSREDV